MEKMTLTETDFERLARLLRKVDFFAPLTVGQLEMILPYVLLLRYGQGEKVFAQGDPGDAFYIVYDGKISVTVKKGLLSFSQQVALLGPGDFFGEMALLAGERRSAAVVCEEPSRLFVLMKADFDYVMKKNPSFAIEVGRIAERRRFNTAHGT